MNKRISITKNENKTFQDFSRIPDMTQFDQPTATKEIDISREQGVEDYLQQLI
jgi:hypothetical protein